MFKWLRELHSEIDNQTLDHAKVLMSGSTLSAVGLQAWSIFVNHAAIDMLAFGGGMAALFGGFSALAKFKKDSGEYIPPPAPTVQVDVQK